MNSTEEWLRYVESQSLTTKYNIKGYTSESLEKEEKES